MGCIASSIRETKEEEEKARRNYEAFMQNAMAQKQTYEEQLQEFTNDNPEGQALIAKEKQLQTNLHMAAMAGDMVAIQKATQEIRELHRNPIFQQMTTKAMSHMIETNEQLQTNLHNNMVASDKKDHDPIAADLRQKYEEELERVAADSPEYQAFMEQDVQLQKDLGMAAIAKDSDAIRKATQGIVELHTNPIFQEMTLTAFSNAFETDYGGGTTTQQQGGNPRYEEMIKKPTTLTTWTAPTTSTTSGQSPAFHTTNTGFKSDVDEAFNNTFYTNED